MSVRKTAVLALFATLSLAIFAVESAIPPLVPIPGIKLGLANIVTLILLRRFSVRDALLVLISRILLSAFLFGQALSLLYSLAGGLCSLCVMAAVMGLLQKKLLFLTGAMGGLTHNLGQLAVAFAVTRTGGVIAYLPFLVLSGILTGLFTGLCAAFAGKLLPPVPSDVS
ncbi:MAG: Gx transporter family protein [Lachnospiraceae bacterium]|nr:Gx transporter family protein [Lachnospiraceae bacterium]